MIQRAGTVSIDLVSRPAPRGLLLAAALALAISSAVACASGARKPLAPVVMFPGGVIWQLAFGSPPAQVPAFDGDRAYIALRDGTLAAVDHASGLVVWSETRPATVPPAAAGRLLVGAQDDTAWAVDAGTGRAIWQHTLPAKAALGPVVSAGGALYLTDGGDAVLLSLDDGRERWKLPVGPGPRTLAASGGGSAWMGFEDGRVLAVDLAGGRISWTRKLPSAALVITPVGDRLLVGSASQFLYALKAKSGGVTWRWRTGGSIAGPAAADAKRIYFVSRDATLRALDRRHGDLRWQRPLSSRAVGGPLLAGEVLIVAGVSPELRGFRTGDGGPAGVVTIPGWAVHAPVLAGSKGTVPSRLLQLTAGGQLLAIGQTVEPPIVPLEVLPGRKLSPEVLAPVR